MSATVVFKTHEASEPTLARFRALRDGLVEHELVVAWDATAGAGPAHLFDGAELFEFGRTELPYPDYRSDHPAWRRAPASGWWNNHWCVLEHALVHGGREAYWLVENDVEIDGGSEVLRAYERRGADFMATYLKTPYRYADLDVPVETPWFTEPWTWVATLTRIDEYARFAGCFFPISYFSGRALEVLHRGHAQGYLGYCEAVVPSLLLAANLSLATLGGTVDTPDRSIGDPAVDALFRRLRHKGATV
jgi:hypothetical protein